MNPISSQTGAGSAIEADASFKHAWLSWRRLATDRRARLPSTSTGRLIGILTLSCTFDTARTVRLPDQPDLREAAGTLLLNRCPKRPPCMFSFSIIEIRLASSPLIQDPVHQHHLTMPTKNFSLPTFILLALTLLCQGVTEAASLGQGECRPARSGACDPTTFDSANCGLKAGV